ncbi:MAG: hypothetical protein A3C36_01180 [Omnitrophica WOR_2 bacterium RIFCSPHIGHO2_02_FULL_52_10]|nr:MAG: hypothetical protein A3C36_01180 [Omnitrophica WOR_2 bacterium RIFCSPHIGHO2_02_FULL_52_10]
MSVSECDGVILCGGQGKRLQGVVQDVPKVMAEVDGRPFLDFILDHLKDQGITRVIMCTGYKADVIETHYRGRDCGVNMTFSRESSPLGTGGALKNARGLIYSDPFFVFNGDSFLAADLQRFLNFHVKKKAEASMIVSQVNERGDYGSLALDDDQKVTAFHEKSDMDGLSIVNAGVYCFNQSIFPRMPNAAQFSLEKEFLPQLTGNKFYGLITSKPFVDIGTPDRYNYARHNLKRGRRA